MKYVRVIDDSGNEYLTTYKEHCEMVAELQDSGFDFEGGILNQADTIEELCDEFVFEEEYPSGLKKHIITEYVAVGTQFGAIWTDKGLIYVAKMNNKGELELL